MLVSRCREAPVVIVPRHEPPKPPARTRIRAHNGSAQLQKCCRWSGKARWFVARMHTSPRHAVDALIPRLWYNREALPLSRVARVAHVPFCRAAQRQHRSAPAGAARARTGALRFAVRGAHGTDFHKAIIQTPARCHRRCV